MLLPWHLLPGRARTIRTRIATSHSICLLRSTTGGSQAGSDFAIKFDDESTIEDEHSVHLKVPETPGETSITPVIVSDDPPERAMPSGSVARKLGRHFTESPSSMVPSINEEGANNMGAAGYTGNQQDPDAPPPKPLHIIDGAAPQHGLVHTKHKATSLRVSFSDFTVMEQLDVDCSPDLPPSSDNGSEVSLDQEHLTDWQVRVKLPTLRQDLTKVFAMDPESCTHDVDPETGNLLPVVKYKRVDPDPSPDLDPDVLYRKQTLTSAIHVMRELKRREMYKATILNARQQKAWREEIANREPDPEWPRANCVLRPATKDHVQQIATIISAVQAEEMCVDSIGMISETMDATSVENVLKHCNFHLRPFIVACLDEKDMLDRSKWPADAEEEYLAFKRFKESQPQKMSMVVGFAYVAEPRIGALNKPCPGSRFSGQVRLAVHPDHRGQQYGTALLDRIMLSMAPYHRSVIDCDWRCVDTAAVYELPSAAHNRRLYSDVWIEIFSKKGRSTPWIQKILDQFGFERASHVDSMVRTDRGHRSEWLDLELWRFRTQATTHDDQPGKWLARK